MPILLALKASSVIRIMAATALIAHGSFGFSRDLKRYRQTQMTVDIARLKKKIEDRQQERRDAQTIPSVDELMRPESADGSCE